MRSELRRSSRFDTVSVVDANLTIGRIAGVEIKANWSLLIAFGLIAWSLATGVFPYQLPGYDVGGYWVAAVAAAILFVGSLLAHELGHALVARRMGVAVEGITLWLFGGVAKLTGDAASALAELRITVVGPVISLALAAAFAVVAAVLNIAQFSPLLVAIFGWLAGINGLLAVFNLVPAFPLDGGRVLRAFVWQRTGDRARATTIAARLGRAFGYLLVGIGLVESFTGLFISGLWFVFLGWFLLGAAGAEESREHLRRALRGLRLVDVMSPNPVVGPDWITVDDLINRFVLSHRFTTFPVQDFGGNLSGLVTLSRLKDVPPERRSATRVRDIAIPLGDVLKASPTDALTDVLDRIGDASDRRVLVLDDGRLVGIVSPRDITRALQVASL